MCGQNGCKEVQHQFLHKVPQSLSQTNDTRPNTFKQIDKVDNNEKDIFRDGVKSRIVQYFIEGEQESSEQQARVKKMKRQAI